MSGHFGTITAVPKCLRSEVSWVRSVLTPHNTEQTPELPRKGRRASPSPRSSPKERHSSWTRRETRHDDDGYGKEATAPQRKALDKGPLNGCVCVCVQLHSHPRVNCTGFLLKAVQCQFYSRQGQGNLRNTTELRRFYKLSHMKHWWWGRLAACVGRRVWSSQ